MELAKLWIELGIKAEGLSKATTDVEKATDKIAKGLDKIGKEMAIAGAAITGALGLIVKKTADAGDRFNDLSQKTGIATEILSGYKLAADKSGSSVETFAVGMKGLAASIFESNKKGSEADKIFKALGIATVDSSGKAKSLNDVFLDTADKFSKMEDGAIKNTLAVKIFGKAGMDLIPTLNLGKQGLEAQREQAEKLGIVFSGSAAKACDDFNDEVTNLKSSMEGMGKTIALSIMPKVQELVQSVTNAIVKVREWAEKNPELTGTLVGITGSIGILLGVLGTSAVAIAKLVTSLKVLGISLSAVGKGVGIMAAAFIGWNIGKKIGEIELFGKSINEHIIGVFDKAIEKLGLYESTAEVATNVNELLTTASKIAGKEITNIGIAMAIVKGEYEKSGTVGNKTLDDWASKSKQADIQTLSLTTTVQNQTKTIEDDTDKLNANIKALLEAEDRKKALVEWTEKLEAHIKDEAAAIQWETDALAVSRQGFLSIAGGIKEASDGAYKFVEALTLGIDKTKKIKDSTDEFIKSLFNITAETQATTNAYNEATYGLWKLGKEGKTTAEQIAEANKKIAEDTKAAMQEVSTVVSDAMRNIASAIVGVVDFKGLFGASPKALKFDDSYYKEMVRAADDAYGKEKDLIDANIAAVESALDDELDAIKSYYDAMEKSANKAFDAAEKSADSAFDAIEDSARKAFDAIEDGARQAYDAQEKLLSRAEQDEDLARNRHEEAEDRKYERQYDRARRSIENSDLTEKEKEKALRNLEKTFEAEKLACEIAREDAKIARDRAREDAKEARQLAFDATKEAREIAYDLAKEARGVANDLAAEARQEAFQLKLEGIRTAQATAEETARAAAEVKEQEFLTNLVGLQNAHQLELDAIRVAEDIARQKQADAEEARQGTLWFKVKGIFATALGEMATIFLTKMLTDPGSIAGMIKKLAGLFTGKGKDELGGALEDAGGSVSTLGETISGFISGIGTGIGGFISGLATGVGAAITTLSGAISGAVVVIAEGIAAAAKALAAAAPELLAIGLVAAAIYTAFSLGAALVSGIASIFGGGGQTDVTYWLKFMKDDIKEIHDHFLDVKSLMFNDYWDCFQTIRDKSVDMYDKLKDIANNTEDTYKALNKIGGFQTGGIAWTPQLATVGEVEPEIIMPLREYQQERNMNNFSSGVGSSGITVHIQQTINAQTLDDNTIRQAGEKIVSEVKWQLRRQGIA